MSQPQPFLSAEHWQHHIAAWQASGITQADYCKKHGLIPHTFWYWKKKLSHTPSGIAVSGEIILHSDALYLQLSQSALMQGHSQILYRRCNSSKDYVGHANNFVEVACLANEDEAAQFIHALKRIGGLHSASLGN